MKLITINIFFALVVPILLGQLLNTFFPFKFVSIPLHSVLETSGGLLAIVIAVLFFIKNYKTFFVSHYNYASIALLAMGIIDIFHASVAPGELFVWLHSIAVFFGGVFYMSVWLKEKHTTKEIYILSSIVFVAFSMLISTYSIALPQYIPQMLNNDGTFTTTANVLNIVGGVGFLTASLKFAIIYFSNKDSHELVFFGHTLLFGIAGLLFVSSVVWDMQWWLWHVLRLIAYIIVCYHLFELYFNEVKSTEDLNMILEEKVNEQTKHLQIANENALKSEEKYRLLFELSDDPMWIIYHNKFVLANNAAIRTMEYTSSEEFTSIHPGIISSKYQENGRLSEELANEMMSIAFDKGYHRFEWLHKKKNGKVFPVEVSLTKIPFENSEGLFCIWRDITEQKEYQEKILAAQREAEEASQAKSNFLANMSHELRTPLNAIIGFSGILNKKQTNEEHKELSKQISRSSHSLLKLINDILDLSKIKNSKFTIDAYQFKAYEEVVKCCQQVNVLDVQKNLVFTTKFGENLKGIFFGDWQRINQVILNLISNAVKFSPKGGEVIINADYKNELFVVSVKDNGIGMNSEVQDKIFKPFEQADGSTTREYGGTGLGLSITQNLVELMHGTIKLESQETKGSTFTVSIPLEKLHESEEKGKDVELSELEKENSLQGHILIVEDNKTNQILIRMLIEDFGLSTDIANDGVEALKIYNPDKHALILMDENMPNMNGIEAMKAIKEKHQDKCTPIIALTANAMQGDKERFLKLGMDGYLAKPIDEDEVYKVLAEFL